MSLRAVIFDYGMVLSGPPDPAAHAAMVSVTGLSSDRLDALYWRHRDDFDKGELTGEAFWRSVARDAKLDLAISDLDRLVDLDALMWMNTNADMLAWQLALKKHGILTAIVSNMGDTVHLAMEREFPWLSSLDVLVWSYQLGIAKPDPAIYRFALEKLDVAPAECLFIDDRAANVAIAKSLGMKAFAFTTVEQLRADIAKSELGELPFP